MYTERMNNLRVYLECAQDEHRTALGSGDKSVIAATRKVVASIEEQLARTERLFVDGLIE